MTAFIPAPAGTTLYRDDLDDRVVVGFALSNGVCLPVVLGRQENIENCRVVFPDSSVVEQLDDTVSPQPPEPRSASKPLTITLPKLDLSGRKYQRNSFWHHMAEPQFVFTLDPETPAPKDKDVNKITRDDLFSLRKQIPEVTTEQLLAVEDDEPELPMEDDDLDGMV